MPFRPLLIVAFLAAALPAIVAEEPVARRPGIRFEVTIEPAVAAAKPEAGRVLVGIARKGAKPDFTRYKPPVLPILGADANDLAPGTTIVLDTGSDLFPHDSIRSLSAGQYSVQAIFATNRDINLPDAPGNRYCEPMAVRLDPAAGTTVKLRLDRRFKEDRLRDSATHRYLAIPSKRLSDFHGRPMMYRVGAVLPANFETETRRYGLVVDIGGFGTRYTDAASREPDPRFVQIIPDGAGPFGDPYQVNSANNGPYGDALVEEVIPHIEKTFRCGGTPKSRFTCGISTGGWVSLALQIFYPDVFNGCWSQCPDSVTFERYELIDLYRDENAFVNRFGFERPSTRTLDGDVVSTVRHEVQLERVLGRGGRWELSGRDWASWNAVYGPLGKDGLPVPVWDGKTGKINRSAAEHWKKYDLKRILEKDWKTLGPKLAGGKIHIWCGDADDYFLNAAVHRFKETMASMTDPPFDGSIAIEMRKGHDHGGWTRKQMLDAMARRAGLK